MTATLDEVYLALQASISNGAVDLVAAAARPSLADVRRTLDALQIKDSNYRLTGVTLRRDSGSVVLTGTGSYGLPGADQAHRSDVTAELSYTIPGGAGLFVLTLAIARKDWKFGDTFPTLPDCQASVGQQVQFVPSFLTALPVEQPALRAIAAEGQPATVRLSGWLPAAGAVAPYADFFGPSWPLALDGSAVIPPTTAEVPELDLIARSERGPISVGPARLMDFGLQLMCVRGQSGSVEEIPLTVLNAVATVELGDDAPVRGDAYMPLLAASSVWRMIVDFGPDAPTLNDGLVGVARAFGLDGAAAFAAPPGVGAITGFRFAEVEAGFGAPGTPAGLRPEDVAVTLTSGQSWTLPVPFLAVSDLGMRWQAGWRGDILPGYISGTFFGTVRVSTGADSFALSLVAYFPGFGVSAWLAEGEIPLDAMLSYFLGVPPPAVGLRVSRLQLDADLTARTVSAAAQLTTDLTFDLPGDVDLRLTEVTAQVNVSQNAVTGGLGALLVLSGGEPAGAPAPELSITAEYAGGGWAFAGYLIAGSVVDLTALVAKFAGVGPPEDFQLLLTELSLSFAPTAGRYRVAGAIATRWQPELLAGPAIAVAASAEISRDDAAAAVAARLTGSFQVAGLVASAAVDLTAREVTYVFTVTIDGRSISAEIDWADEPERHRVITIRIGQITLGELIEFLVGLVAPTIGFRLEPPWDILGKIELSRFVLVIDPEYGTVELTYHTRIPLPTMTLTGIGLRARRINGKPAVVLVLDREEQAPLNWDLLSGTPPAVPGQGSGLVRVDYLGLGQRVRMSGAPPATLREGIARLRQDLREPADPNANPLRQPTGARMTFDADAGWLAGLDLTLADAVQVALLFSDPQLYGLAIGLRGEKLAALAGLRFEILYKKVSADAGVFRTELELPEAVRRIQLGAVSLTIGTVVVEVFTNGDFRVDLGFPHRGDFSRSFTVEVLPFLGRGGVYFGKLGAATSSRVPAISNGTFQPVLELGLGLAVGVGKEIRAGVLSGGAYLEVVAIFEGVFAWFNPDSAATPAAQYHWISALVAIHGKLYGQVDLSVLKVAVTVEAWASATAILESYRATEFQLSARVDVRAELTIIFVQVSFTFSAAIDLAFTVGTDGTPPWQLSAGQGSTGQARLRGNILPPVGRVPRRRLELLRAAHRRGRDGPGWEPTLPVFRGGVRETARLTMLPVLGLTDVPVSWAGPAPGNPSPQYRAALMVLAQHTEPAGDDAGDPRKLAAQLLVEALLRWSISSETGSPGNDPAVVVTAGQLRELAEKLDDPRVTAGGGPFAIEQLATFFGTNLRLEIAGQPAGQTQAAPFGGTALPLPPLLTLASPQIGPAPRDLASYNEVGLYYLWGAAGYAAGLSPTPRPAGPPPDDDPDAYRSYATHLFQDWCLMTAKAAVDAAAGLLARWPVSLAGPASLADVAGLFATAPVGYLVRAGDTLDSVAAALGASPAELSYHNPGLAQRLAEVPAGDSITVVIGVAPEGLAIDNVTVPLRSLRLDLGTIDYQAAADDTLASIAASFGQPAGGLFPDGLASPLAADPALLRPGATFAMPQVFRPDPGSLGRLLTAAIFFSHYQALTEVDSAGWYAAALFDLNADRITWGPDDEIPPGFVLHTPAAFGDADPDHARRYTAIPGDTLSSVARTLALVQLFESGPAGPPGWAQFRDGTVPNSGGHMIPAAEVPVLPRQSLAGLASRLIVSSGDLNLLLGYVGGQPILTPLTVVSVPHVQVDSGGRTIGDLADLIGLSIEDLAARIAEEPVFAADATLTAAHVPAHYTDTLVDEVLDGSAVRDIFAQTARNVLSGARLPAPARDDAGRTAAIGALTSVCDLTGQQLAAPAPDPARPGDVRLEITVTVNPEAAAWIALVGSVVAGPADTVAGLASAADGESGFADLNPELAADPTRLRAGLIVRTGPAAALKFSYTNAELQQLYPATGLVVTPFTGQGPAPLPVADKVPRTYGLDLRIELQAPMPLPLPEAMAADQPSRRPGPLADVPAPAGASAWPLPEALAARAGQYPNTQYRVLRASRRPDAPEVGEPLPGSTFATLIRLRVRAISGLRNGYELIGAEQASRGPLLALWSRLGATAARIFVAAAPAPDAGHTGGLAILDADPAATFLIRANQSTQTAPPAAAPAAGGGPPYADLTAPGDFLRLLWQGTVVGGTGYYLGFAATDGSGLPAAAFDDSGVAALALLVLTADEQRPVPGGRYLLPYENCVLLPAGPDPSTAALWVESDDTTDVITVPTVPPGCAGFGLTLQPPQPPAGDAALRLGRLYSLVRYSIIGGGPFTLPDAGLPVGPQADDGDRAPAWQRARTGDRGPGSAPGTGDEPDKPLWRYEQVLPLSRLGPPSPCPAVPGLPAPAGDPYRGAGSAADIRLGLSDVLGNVTAAGASPPAGSTARLPLACTDPLLGLGGWPGMTAAYWVDGGADGARLHLSITAQPGTTMPTSGQDGSGSADAAARATELFARAYYQLAAQRAEATVVSTLRQAPAGTPAPLPVDVTALWRLTAAGYLAAAAAGAVAPVYAGGSLAGIRARHGSGYAEIASANAGRPAVPLVGTEPTMPAYAAVLETDSAQDILDRLRPGWPRPNSAADLLRLPQNASEKLRAGTALSTPVRPVAVPPDRPTLASVADDYHTSPALLAADSADLAGTLSPGFSFELEGISVAVPAGSASFGQIRQAFADLGVIADIETIATASAERDGMLSGTALTSRHYIAQAGDTLASNDSQVADLAAANGQTPDIFPAGAALLTGTFDRSRVTVTADETLAGLAARFGCPPPRLLAANADREVTGTPVIVPGAVRLPDAAPIRVPYTITAGDTLAGVERRFSGPETGGLALATDNQAMPGTLVPSMTVVVEIDGRGYQTNTMANDSLAAVQQRLAQQDPRIGLAEVVYAIADTPGYLAAGGLLSCPPARLPGAGPVSPADASAPYGLDPVAVALANAAVTGLVQPGVELAEQCGSRTVVAGPDDTLNGLTGRFADIGVTIGVAEIVAANATRPFWRGGALALLPPAPAALAVGIGPAGPFATPATPLTVALRLQRPDALVDPALRTPGRDGPAERAETMVPARATVESSCETQTRTLAPFAAAFHAALPSLRLATGRIGGSAAEVEADLWVVDFGPDGIARVDVSRGAALPDGRPCPRSYAIRPLYREPVTRLGVQVPTVAPDGSLTNGPLTDFQEVDVEPWARRFLSDIDTALSAAYASGLYGDPVGRAALARLLAAKEVLAGAVAIGVDEVLELPVGASPDQFDAARRTLRDRLAVELGSGYDTAALVQYNAAVRSPWTAGSTAPPARLLGTPAPVPRPAGTNGVPYQLTAAKTALDRPESTVTFLLSVPDPRLHSAVDIALDYDLTHLEHDIRVVGGPGGYPDSDWLTFYPPLRGAHRPAAVTTSLGDATIPIPLRAYPAAPALIGQGAEPTFASPEKLTDAGLWTYSLNYAHEHAAQDEVQVTAAFNVAEARQRADRDDAPDLATELACYQAAADQLWALLAAFGGSGGSRSTAARAADSLAGLAENVTDAWAAHWRPAAETDASAGGGDARPAAGPTETSYGYSVSASYGTGVDDTDYLSAVHLRLDQATPGPGGSWPQVWCRADDGRPVKLDEAQPGGLTRDYLVPGGVEVTKGNWLTLTLRWPGLRITDYQNARATLSVRRNHRLLGPLQPPTTGGFLFQTATVSAPATVSPVLVRSTQIDISGYGTEPGAALQRALRELAGPGSGTQVTISAWYGYDLVPVTGPGARLSTRLPVALLPRGVLTDGTGNVVAGKLQSWLRDNSPAPEPGRCWLYSVTVHASLPGAHSRPLLTADRLRYAHAAQSVSTDVRRSE